MVSNRRKVWETYSGGNSTHLLDLAHALANSLLFLMSVCLFRQEITNQTEKWPVCLNLLSVCICSSTYLSFTRSCTDWTMTGVSGNSLKRICQPVSHFLAICGSFPRKCNVWDGSEGEMCEQKFSHLPTRSLPGLFSLDFWPCKASYLPWALLSCFFGFTSVALNVFCMSPCAPAFHQL